ncbi:MAG: acyl carrier protein [Blautia sp.]|nr:acyl carrier protein [Blautia sp.]
MIEKVKEILLNYTEAPIDGIKSETDLVKDLGLSSLDVVNLIVTFEDEFGIEVSDRTIRDLKTVGDIIECLERGV